jgi:serine/threonine-protein kinase Chk2
MFLPEEEVKLIMKQVFTGFRYIHDKFIGHRDVKLDNIMIIDHNNHTEEELRPVKLNVFEHNFTMKIVDFGFSVGAKYPKSSYAGSPSYMAP